MNRSGFQDWEIFSKAFVLTAANIIGLVLGMIIIFFIKGITPTQIYEKEKARLYYIFTIVISIGLSILLAYLST